jgi:PIF1-like helicase
MQHCHIHEAVNRTFKDIRQCEDKPFGGLTVVFGGDFKQILPVIVKRSQPEIVGACIQRSRLWQFVKILKLTENMCLNTHVEAKRYFARWQLDIGHGRFTDETGSITLPAHFKCTENTIASLVQTILILNKPTTSSSR